MIRTVCWLTVTLAFGGQAAHACLNDSELPHKEREFRSQYLDSQLFTDAAVPSVERDSTTLMAGAGIVMLTAAFTVTLLKRD